jgi:hypothetical protein
VAAFSKGIGKPKNDQSKEFYLLYNDQWAGFATGAVEQK